uniref:Uncharacterized protein n=1 Tax=Opuntia streptacantha TaxID=393608 RepID=A0A7C9E995_OPUST
MSPVHPLRGNPTLNTSPTATENVIATAANTTAGLSHPLRSRRLLLPAQNPLHLHRHHHPSQNQACSQGSASQMRSRARRGRFRMSLSPKPSLLARTTRVEVQAQALVIATTINHHRPLPWMQMGIMRR